MHTHTKKSFITASAHLGCKKHHYLNVLQHFTDLEAYFPLSFLRMFWVKITAHYLGRKAFLKSVFFVFACELLMEMNSWQIKSPWSLGQKKKKPSSLRSVNMSLEREQLLSTVVYQPWFSLHHLHLFMCTEKKEWQKSQKYWVIWL